MKRPPSVDDTPMETRGLEDHGTEALARRAGTVVGGTLLSRLLGLGRDAVIAATFDVRVTDLFFVALTVPNTLRGLLGEGAVSAAFIPVFAAVRERQGHAAARAYFARFAGAMAVILLAVSALGVATAPLWAFLYGSGYQREPARFSLLVDLTRMLLPYLAFAGLSALAMGALNALGRFAVAAFAPALLNVSLIAAPVLWLPLARVLGIADIKALAVAALAGGLLQVIVQLPALRRVNMLPRPHPDFRDPVVRRSLSLMVPLLLGAGIHQVDMLLSRQLASYLPEGSQSFLYYSQRVVEIPQGMFAVAIASAALPSLAALHQQGKHEAVLSTLRFSLRLSLFVSIPASMAIGALAEPIVTVLFGRGSFDPVHVRETARSLAVLAASVWGVATIHPLVRMFHAHGDTRSPVICGGLNVATFVGVSLATMGKLDHVAIALGNAVATLVQLGALLFLLRRALGPLHLTEVWGSALRSGAAGLAMAAVIAQLARLGQWSAGGNDPLNLTVFAGCVTAGVAAYGLVAYLLRSPELRELTRSLRRRRNR